MNVRSAWKAATPRRDNTCDRFEKFGGFSAKFYEVRNRTLSFLGLSAVVLFICVLIVTLIQNKGNPDPQFLALTICLFAVPISGGFVVYWMPKLSESPFLPGGFVLEKLKDELGAESTPDAVSQASFEPVLSFLDSSVLKTYSKEQIQILLGTSQRSQEVVEMIQKQAGRFVAAGSAILRDLNSQKNPVIGFSQARSNADKAIKELEKLQELITKSLGPAGLVQFKRRCIEALKQESFPPQDLDQLIEKAEASLATKEPLSGPNIAEKICLNFRALYIGCLITATFYPTRWSEIETERILELFDCALRRMRELDEKSPYIYNVERRQLLVGDLVGSPILR
jgi:hypothetical protein